MEVCRKYDYDEVRRVGKIIASAPAGLSRKQLLKMLGYSIKVLRYLMAKRDVYDSVGKILLAIQRYNPENFTGNLGLLQEDIEMIEKLYALGVSIARVAKILGLNYNKVLKIVGGFKRDASAEAEFKVRFVNEMHFLFEEFPGRAWKNPGMVEHLGKAVALYSLSKVSGWMGITKQALSSKLQRGKDYYDRGKINVYSAVYEIYSLFKCGRILEGFNLYKAFAPNDFLFNELMQYYAENKPIWSERSVWVSVVEFEQKYIKLIDEDRARFGGIYDNK